MTTDSTSDSEQSEQSLPTEKKEQCFLIENWREFTANNRTKRYRNFVKLNSAQQKTSSEIINNIKGVGGLDKINNLEPHYLGMLQPELRVYRADLVNGEWNDKEFIFDQYRAGWFQPHQRHILDPSGKSIAAAGIKSFQVTNNGNNEVEVNSRLEASLEIFMTSLEEIDRRRPGGIRISDLMARPRTSTDPQNYRIKVSMGWAVPAQGGIPEREYRNLRDFARRSKKVFILHVIKHKIDLRDDGSIGISIDYIASIDGARRGDHPNARVNRPNAVFPMMGVLQGALSQEDLSQYINTRFEIEGNQRFIECVNEREATASENPTDSSSSEDQEERAEDLAETNEDKVRENKTLLFDGFTKALLNRGALHYIDLTPQELGEPPSNSSSEINRRRLARIRQEREEIENAPRPEGLTAAQDFHRRRGQLQQINTRTTEADRTPSEADSPPISQRIKRMTGEDIDVLIEELEDENALYEDSSFWSFFIDDDTDAQRGQRMEEATEEASRDAARESSDPVTGRNTRVMFLYLGDLIDIGLEYFRHNSTPIELKQVVPIVLPVQMARIDSQSQFEQVSLADIPISLHNFQIWFSRNIISRGRETIDFNQWMQLISSQLLRTASGSSCADFQGDNSDASTRTITLSVDRASSPHQNNFGFRTLQDTTPISLIANWRHQPIPEEEISNISNTVNFLAIHAPSPAYRELSYFDRTSSGGRHSTREERDLSLNILTLKYGAHNGITKNIKYVKRENGPLTNSNMITAEQQNGASGGAIDVEPYNANVTMLGNNSITPMSVVRLNPLAWGSESTTNRLLRNLAGYYNVKKSTSTIEPGKFETELECWWQSPIVSRREDAYEAAQEGDARPECPEPPETGGRKLSEGEVQRQQEAIREVEQSSPTRNQRVGRTDLDPEEADSADLAATGLPGLL